METWSKGHSGTRICLTCKGLADWKPVGECRQQKHWNRFNSKLSRNNEYRRQRRAAAREAGKIDRTGRGILANKTEYARRKHLALRDILMERLGQNSCVKCGFSDKRALHFDHSKGGGRKHRRSLPSGTAYYRSLIDMSQALLQETFQVLCANCNAIKRDEQKEWRWSRQDTAQAK